MHIFALNFQIISTMKSITTFPPLLSFKVWDRVSFYQLPLLMCASLLWVGASSPHPVAGPILTIVDNQDIKLEQISASDKFSKVVDIKNTGDSPLKLESCTTTSTYVTAKPDLQPIAPGGKGKITIIINCSGSDAKELNAVVNIYSNDPNSANKKIRIRGEIKSSIEIKGEAPKSPQKQKK